MQLLTVHRLIRSSFTTYIQQVQDERILEALVQLYAVVLKNILQTNFQYFQGGAKNGASLSHCKYCENSITALCGNWRTSAILC